MTKQMGLLTSHLDSSKKMQETLLQAMTQQRAEKQERWPSDAESEERMKGLQLKSQEL